MIFPMTQRAKNDRSMRRALPVHDNVKFMDRHMDRYIARLCYYRSDAFLTNEKVICTNNN